MTNEKRFPIFTHHSDVTCFNCGEPLEGSAREPGYPEGRWRQRCEHCDISTFYDVAEMDVA